MTSIAVVKFQLRRDTVDNWLRSGVRLEEGEPGFDITNNILKIGPKGGAMWKDIPNLTAGIFNEPIRVTTEIPKGFYPLYYNSTTREIIQVAPQ
jgi:hypothetical protein